MSIEQKIQGNVCPYGCKDSWVGTAQDCTEGN